RLRHERRPLSRRLRRPPRQVREHPRRQGHPGLPRGDQRVPELRHGRPGQLPGRVQGEGHESPREDEEGHQARISIDRALSSQLSALRTTAPESRQPRAESLSRAESLYLYNPPRMSALWALAAFVMTLAGGAFAFRYRRYLLYIMAASAGLLIGVAFLDLSPEVVELAHQYSIA